MPYFIFLNLFLNNEIATRIPEANKNGNEKDGFEYVESNVAIEKL